MLHDVWWESPRGWWIFSQQPSHYVANSLGVMITYRLMTCELNRKQFLSAEFICNDTIKKRSLRMLLDHFGPYTQGLSMQWGSHSHHLHPWPSSDFLSNSAYLWDRFWVSSVRTGRWNWLCMLSQSCLTLCNPMNLPGSSLHGIFQARILERVPMPSSRGSSRPRDQTCVSCISCIGRWILSHCTTWEANIKWFWSLVASACSCWSRVSVPTQRPRSGWGSESAES